MKPMPFTKAWFVQRQREREELLVAAENEKRERICNLAEVRKSVQNALIEAGYVPLKYGNTDIEYTYGEFYAVSPNKKTVLIWYSPNGAMTITNI